MRNGGGGGRGGKNEKDNREKTHAGGRDDVAADGELEKGKGERCGMH